MRLNVIECYWTKDDKRAALVELTPFFGRKKTVLFVNRSGNGRREKGWADPTREFELAFNWFDRQGREVSDYGLGPFSIGLSNQLDRAFSHHRSAGTVKEIAELTGEHQ